MNLSFVIISENALCIANKSETKSFKYSDYNFYPSDKNLIVKLLIKTLEENRDKNKYLCLILCDNYSTSSTECTEHFKKSVKFTGNEIEKVKCNTSFFNGNNENDFTGYLKKPIQIFTEVYNSSSRVEGLSQIPEKSKYYLKTTKYLWKTKLLSYLTDELKYFGYNIKSIVPLAMFSNYCFPGKIDQSLVLTYYENSSVINLFENGILRRQKSIQTGFNSLIEKVSNHFNISIDNSKLIIEKYGYVFLPPKYTNFVIDIPVFEDIFREVELTELSYIIREGVKKITENLLSNTQNDNINISDYEKLVFNSSIYLPGFDKFLELMTGIKSNYLDFKELSFSEFSVIQNIILGGEKDSASALLKEVDYELETNESIEHSESLPHMINKLKDYLNSNFRQRLAEI